MMGSRKQWWAFASVVTGLSAGIVAVEYLSPPTKPPTVNFNQEEREEAQDGLINQVETTNADRTFSGRGDI